MPTTNPFSTRHTRPGRIMPLDGQGSPLDIVALLDRLHRCGSCAIIGPHGSGKSTLLLRLADAIEAAGGRVRLVRVRSWFDVWHAIVASRIIGRNGTVCIDGWECLPRLARALLRFLSWWGRRGLLVTAHQPDSMTTLATCRTSPVLLESIVGRLPGRAAWYGTLIDAADVRDAYARQRGDIREALYDLYDVFERRSRRFVPRRS